MNSGTHVIVVLLDDGLVEADGLLVLVLHEEHVGYVQFPGIVLIADLDWLAENLLHHIEVLPVPVDFGLGHQDHDVSEAGSDRSHGKEKGEIFSGGVRRDVCVTTLSVSALTSPASGRSPAELFSALRHLEPAWHPAPLTGWTKTTVNQRLLKQLSLIYRLSVYCHIYSIWIQVYCM